MLCYVYTCSVYTYICGVCVFVCDLIEINESEESFVPASKTVSLKS